LLKNHDKEHENQKIGKNEKFSRHQCGKNFENVRKIDEKYRKQNNHCSAVVKKSCTRN